MSDKAIGAPILLVRLFRALWSVNPVWGAAASLCAGIIVVVASFPLNLAFVSYEAAGGLVKQVGFVPSLNWSVPLVFLFPAAIFLALRAVRLLRTTLRTLAHHKMLGYPDWSPAGDAQADALITEVWRASAPIGIFFMAVGLAVGGWDFATVVAGPMMAGALPLAPGQTDFSYEIDWSVAALLGDAARGKVPGITSNFAFAGIAHALLIGQIALLLSFYGLLVGLSVVLYRMSDGDHALRLRPDATSTDRRRGFQIFEGFFNGILGVSLMAYLACYFMRIQNLFLRDADFARLDQLLFSNIAESLGSKIIVPDDLSSALHLAAKSVIRVADAVFTTGDLADTQAYLGVGIILIGTLLVTLALFVVLRGVAEEGRQAAVRDAADPARRAAMEAFYGLPAAERLRADNMDEWPLRWPRLNTFIAYLALGVACFFFYRLALLWIALQIWQLLRKWPKG